MKNMVEDGAIAPFTTEAGSTGHISVRGNNNRNIDYNVIRYCPVETRSKDLIVSM